MTGTLISREDAESKIASLTTSPCSIAVTEEHAFVGKNKGSPNGWLQLGSVSLKMAPQPVRKDIDAEHYRALLAGAGAFEWLLPSASDTKAALGEVLGDEDGGSVRRALDSVAAICVRAGLVNPTFDAEAIEDLPFRRTATVVSDTSGVLQGGLDFIARYVPKARVKVPAIVQMEIRNLSDRFLKMRRDRRSAKREQRGTKQLMAHLESQGAERVLLRLELRDDVEIERTYLLGDPLRNAFVPDKDRTLNDLQLSVPLDAYVDRLILEAARHHRAQSEPGHAVLLLTSDQGQARMALAEGVQPLYFRSIRANEVFGQRLIGRPLDPFTGEPRPVPLASLLWELATAFGCARMTSLRGTFTVSAIGEDLPWSPYHSTNDLLWYEIEDVSDAAIVHRPSSEEEPESATIGGSSPAKRRTPKKVSYQRMNVNHLLRIICVVDDRSALEQAEVSGMLGLSSYSTLHYRRFLLSAGLIRLEGRRWVATDRLKGVSRAARDGDPMSLREALGNAPSFRALVDRVERTGQGEPIDMATFGQSVRTYLTLGEATLTCASVGKDAVFPTMSRPSVADFGRLALARFNELAAGGKIVATGLWLESLIRHDGIHPEIARPLLERASDAGLIRRSTEGSTTQSRYDDHVVHVLRVEDGMPIVRPVHLYRGDYLIPGKASVSLRVEEPRR